MRPGCSDTSCKSPQIQRRQCILVESKKQVEIRKNALKATIVTAVRFLVREIASPIHWTGSMVKLECSKNVVKQVVFGRFIWDLAEKQDT